MRLWGWRLVLWVEFFVGRDAISLLALERGGSRVSVSCSWGA